MLDKNFPFYALIFGATFALTILIEKALVPFLAGKAKQPIYHEGPSWHETKSGTPTMGGLAFLISITTSIGAVIAYMFTSGKTELAVPLLISLVYSVANALIGLFDDLKKLRRKENKGLSAKEKIIFKVIAAVGF